MSTCVSSVITRSWMAFAFATSAASGAWRRGHPSVSQGQRRERMREESGGERESCRTIVPETQRGPGIRRCTPVGTGLPDAASRTAVASAPGTPVPGYPGPCSVLPQRRHRARPRCAQRRDETGGQADDDDDGHGGDACQAESVSAAPITTLLMTRPLVMRLAPMPTTMPIAEQQARPPARPTARRLRLSRRAPCGWRTPAIAATPRTPSRRRRRWRRATGPPRRKW